MKSIDEETTRERQSRVVKAGGKWEEYVRLFLNEKLEKIKEEMKKEGKDIPCIEVIYGKNENTIKERSINLWRMLSLPLKASTYPNQSYVWGDLDLVAIVRDKNNNEIPVTIISCKTSLHGRFTETLFWSLLFRTLTQIKVVLATCDSGKGKKGKWESEWGTPDNPSKDRLLAESYLDGVYVENVPEFCPDKKPEEKTICGGIVRPLDELPYDLINWSIRILKIIRSPKGLERFG
jgi:hypothetical protein